MLVKTANFQSLRAIPLMFYALDSTILVRYCTHLNILPSKHIVILKLTEVDSTGCELKSSMTGKDTAVVFGKAITSLTIYSVIILRLTLLMMWNGFSAFDAVWTWCPQLRLHLYQLDSLKDTV